VIDDGSKVNPFVVQMMCCCRDPTLKECEDDIHTPEMGTWGVLRDSWKLITRVQGSKKLALRCSLYCWKCLEAQMSKMALHEPFGHLQHKLCAKEGSGVKLTIWLSTIKSRESTRPRCVQVECDPPLKRSKKELQVCFRPHSNQRFEQGVINCQSPMSPNRDNFGTILGLFLGSPGEKWHSDVGATE
jgi:hypothetical protein